MNYPWRSRSHRRSGGRPSARPSGRGALLTGATVLLLGAGAVIAPSSTAQTPTAQTPTAQTPSAPPPPPTAICGQPRPLPPAPSPQATPQHVIVVQMENQSYSTVVGSPNAPYQTQLANQCGVATSAFGATHASAANYLAFSAGEFPATAAPGCGKVADCADPSDNLYSQLTRAGLSWTAYEESMPTPCDPTSGSPSNGTNLYKIGHNPPLFYPSIPAAECRANDVGVDDLTAHSGPFWTALQTQTLPSLSFVTPNTTDDGEGPGTEAQAQQVGDAWLHRFVDTVTQSPSYRRGNTLLLVNYDEGTGADSTVGEDCTNKALDLPVVNGVSAHQESCHIPLFVVYPFTPTGAHDDTFFDTYSLTRTVEQLFGLPYLAHAGDVQTTSLVGHFGIGTPTR